MMKVVIVILGLFVVGTSCGEAHLSEDARSLLVKADDFISKKSWSAALQTTRMALDLSKSSSEIMEKLGNITAKLGKWEDALGWYEKGVRQGDEVRMYSKLNIANLNCHLNKMDECRRSLQEYLRDEPEHCISLHNLGRVLEHDGELAAALEAHVKAAKSCPESKLYNQYLAIFEEKLSKAEALLEAKEAAASKENEPLRTRTSPSDMEALIDKAYKGAQNILEAAEAKDEL